MAEGHGIGEFTSGLRVDKLLSDSPGLTRRPASTPEPYCEVVPCVVGAYTSVAGTLTLLENTFRASPAVPRGNDQPDYRRDAVPGNRA